MPHKGRIRIIGQIRKDTADIKAVSEFSLMKPKIEDTAKIDSFFKERGLTLSEAELGKIKTCINILPKDSCQDVLHELRSMASNRNLVDAVEGAGCLASDKVADCISKYSKNPEALLEVGHALVNVACCTKNHYLVERMAEYMASYFEKPKRAIEVSKFLTKSAVLINDRKRSFNIIKILDMLTRMKPGKPLIQTDSVETASENKERLN